MHENNRLATTPLPEPTLRRLPWYLAYLTTLRTQGQTHVSSTRIAADVGVDSSQIARVVADHGGTGKAEGG